LSSKTHKDYAEEFKKTLERVLENGISLSVIAEKIGVNRQKLYNINAGRSSGDVLMLNKLKETYSDILSKSNSNKSVSDFSSREKEMQAEIDRLKKKVEEKEDRIMKLIDLMYGDKKEGKS